MFRHFIMAIAFALTAVATNAQQTNTNLYAQTSEMNDLMINYAADKGSISRFYSSTDAPGWGRMRYGNDYNTPERRQRLLQLIDEYLKKMQQISFDNMNVNGKVDYLLFKRNLDGEKYDLLAEQKDYEKIAVYFPFSEKIYDLEKPRRRGLTVDGEAVAKELNNLKKDIIKSYEALQKGDSIDMKYARYASETAKALQSTLKSVYTFYNGYDPMFTWWVPATYQKVDSVLGKYADALQKRGVIKSTQKDDGSGIIGNPIGREEIIRQLKYEYIPYTPEELVDIANKEFAWCDTELLKASKEMGFGNDWKAAQEKVKNSYVAPGKQPEAMFDLYRQSIEFLKKNDLITIPALSEETWRMLMMSPERQLVNPFFLGGEALIISYPANTMDYDEKMMSMRGNNPHFSRATVHHELIAGHHLQGYMSNRYKTYRNFDTPFWVEGNALYWELLLWDMKFPRSAKDRIGMLFWRMHRCARIIFSLNYHLGKWTPQQCIDFLVDRVGHERANAEGEVRRSFVGGYSPLYQIAYMIGGLQQMALKRELVDTKKMTIKQFNDALLHENSMPIEMLRAIIINQPLKKDFKTEWRFYK